jgi:integrase
MNYTNQLLPHLTRLEGCDLHEVTTEQRQEVYAAAMLNEKGEARQDLEKLLRLFEQTLLDRVDVDDEVDWLAIPHARQSEPRIDANIIDPLTYHQLIDVLQEAEFSHSIFQQCAISAAILLYRFGLRRGEAQEIVLADIQWVGEEALLLKVRPSRLTRLKSKHGSRTVGPIILPANERTHLRSHVRRCLADVGDNPNLASVYLFAQKGRASALMGKSVLFDPLVNLVRWLTGDRTLRIRHFRHGFGSRLFLAGRSPDPALDELLVRPASWRAAYEADGAWLRTYEMGHLSPMTAIQVYTQTNVLAHYAYCAKALPALVELRTLATFAGLGERSLEREVHRYSAQPSDMLPAVTTCFLAAVRRRWPATSSTSVDAISAELPRVRISFAGEPYSPINYAPRFADLEAIVTARLKNSLSLTFWEQNGVPIDIAQRWSEMTSVFIGVGLFDADYARQFKLKSKLVDHGDQLLHRMALYENPIAIHRLLMRALVGMRGSYASLRLDPASATKLCEWFNFGSADAPMLTQSPASKSKVDVRLSLMGKDSPGLRWFLLLTAANTLSVDDVLQGVLPYIQSHKPHV